MLKSNYQRVHAMSLHTPMYKNQCPIPKKHFRAWEKKNHHHKIVDHDAAIDDDDDDDDGDIPEMTLILKYQCHYHHNTYGGCSQSWYPTTALTPPFRALSRPSRIGTGNNNDHGFVCIFENNKYRRIVLETQSSSKYYYNYYYDYIRYDNHIFRMVFLKFPEISSCLVAYSARQLRLVWYSRLPIGATNLQQTVISWAESRDFSGALSSDLVFILCSLCLSSLMVQTCSYYIISFIHLVGGFNPSEKYESQLG